MQPTWRPALLASALITLSACGGSSSSGHAGGEPGPGPELPPCETNADGAALIGCFSGTYEPDNIYLGAPAWTQLVISTDGDLHFAGEESLSILNTDILSVEEGRDTPTERHKRLLVLAEADGITREISLYFNQYGDVSDIAYETDTLIQGASLAPLPDWESTAIGSGNHISLTLDGRHGQIYARYIDDDVAYDDTSLAIAAGAAPDISRLGIDGGIEVGGHYFCHDNAYLEVSVDGVLYTADAPGRCRLEIVDIQDLGAGGGVPNYIEGRIVAELQAQGEPPERPRRIYDGRFRFQP